MFFCTSCPSKSLLERYRCDSGMCRITNRKLRLKKVAQIYNLYYFLADFYQQLDEMYRRQNFDDQDSVVLINYRGQQMSLYELRNLTENIDHSVFTNSFFSTTFNLSVANTYAEAATHTTETVSVLFEIEIDKSHEMQPYGYITNSGDGDSTIVP